MGRLDTLMEKPAPRSSVYSMEKHKEAVLLYTDREAAFLVYCWIKETGLANLCESIPYL